MKMVPSSTVYMTTMLLAPPNVPEYLLWIFTNSWLCGDEVAEARHQAQLEGPVREQAGDEEDDDHHWIAPLDELVAEPVERALVLWNFVVESHRIPLVFEPYGRACASLFTQREGREILTFSRFSAGVRLLTPSIWGVKGLTAVHHVARARDALLGHGEG